MTEPQPDDIDAIERRPYADFDEAGRRRKARKILEVLRRRRPLENASVLEIGTGSGVAASELVEAVGPDGRVCAADVDDMRVVTEGYEFTVLDGVELPYEEDAFDIVISNHVMEHVGGDASQLAHLGEIRRVLRPEGVVYFAVPNRWRIIEPHLKLPLLSWFPKRLADRYVRLARRGEYYDVNPPSYRKLERLLVEAGFSFEEATYEQMRIMAEVEDPRPLTRVLLRAPRWMFRAVRPVISSMIYVLRLG